MAPTVGYLVCWTGPPELLEINVRNHRWVLQDFEHEIFVGCRTSQRNRYPELPGVTYVDRDTREYEFTLGHYLPDELLNFDVVILNQLDQFWKAKFNRTIAQVAKQEEDVFVRDNSGYQYLTYDGRTFPRVWEGGLIVNANLVRRWQADGILMSRLLDKATEDCETRNPEMYKQIREIRLNAGGGKRIWCPEHNRWDINYDFGFAVQHWMAASGIMPVTHEHTTHFQGVEISLDRSGNGDRSLSEFSLHDYLNLEIEFYPARWPIFLMFLIFAGYRISDDDRALLKKRVEELPCAATPEELRRVRNEIAGWHTELESIDQWIDYFENQLLPLSAR